MERPGLQALIADIKLGKVDIIVVYKVDRLTRSLADFAKLVEVFDTHDVSFVSITQAFNTTTSMGRLTLNVLLSFAQFEREVTAERIKDKIAASKARGKWMGGLVPLGYDNVDTALVINKSEAETINTIFKLYLKLGSVPALKSELDTRGLVTKRRTTSKKRQSGGISFSRGHLYKLLCNPIYIGRVRHKDNTYDGEHEAILDMPLWEAVQAKLKGNAPQRRRTINVKSGSLLTGIIYDHAGDRLTPIHTKKNGRRYRYYISRRISLGEDNDDSGWRLPAPRIETHVISKLTALLEDPVMLMDTFNLNDLPQSQLKSITDRAGSIAASINDPNPQIQRDTLLSLTERIEVHPDKLTIIVNKQRLFPETNSGVEPITLQYHLIQKRRGVETRLIIGGTPVGLPDLKLIEIIAKARNWHGKLISKDYTSLQDIAVHETLDKAEVSRTLPLAFLAPSIVRDILKGHQPIDLTADTLRRKSSSLPLCWKAQRIFLGFSA